MTTKYIHSTTKVDSTTKKLQMENTIIDCDISVDGNDVKNINFENLKRQAVDGTDAGKVFAVRTETSGTNAGKWELVKIQQYLKQPKFLDTAGTALVPGDEKTLYYHPATETLGTVTYQKGMFIWDSSAGTGGTGDYVACSIEGNVPVDDLTVTTDSTTGAIKLQLGDATTKGIKTENINLASFTKSTDTFPAKADALDTKLVSEKAIAKQLEDRVPYDQSSTNLLFKVGVDADGHYYFLS